MALINDNAVLSAYKKLSAEQKERFFQGKEALAKKVIGSLVYLLGANCNYSQLLELYITAAVRVMMGFDNERINVTVKIRFSDIVPENKALTVIECIRRLFQNYAYIDKSNSPEMQAHNRFFDSQSEARFKENEQRLNDAAQHPGFGTSPDNPIFAHSSDGSYAYLNLLYTSDLIPLTWRRICSMSVQSSRDLLDQYELLLPDGTVYLTVYINMYSRKSSVYCPQGLVGEGLKNAPGVSPVQTKTAPDDTDELSEEDEYLAFLQNYAKDSSTPPNRSNSTNGTGKFIPKNNGQNNSGSPTKEEPPSPDEVLNEDSTYVLQGTLPVVLVKRTVFRKKNGELYAVCSFLPVTDKSILAMEVDVRCYNVWHDSIQPVEGVQYNDLKTTRATHFGDNVVIPLPDKNTRSIEIVVRRIMLASGRLLQRSGENIDFPDTELLSERFGDDELLNEYQTLTYKNAKFTPVKAGAFWRCTCGTINSNDEPACHTCRDFASVLFKHLNKDALQSIVNEKKRLQREKEEQARIAREEAKKKEEEERRTREIEAAELRRVLAEKRKLRNKRISIASAVLAATALIVYLVGWQLVPSAKYKNADKLLNSGDRDAAYAAFAALGEFRDSSDRASAIKYEDAKATFDAGDYDKAIKLFKSIPSYQDSAVRANESIYVKATRLMKKGSYADAAEWFGKITGYKDSITQETTCKNEIKYLEATEQFNNGQYKEAGEQFEALKSFRDSASLMTQAYYLYAKELIESEDLHEAYIILSSKVNRSEEGHEDSIDLANTSEYQYALNCFKEEKYADAAESFANIKDYIDSANRYLEARYQYGLILLSESKNDEAEKLFAELGNYKDSARQYNEARYQIALLHMGLNEYQEAEKIFEELGYYSDSQTQLKEAKYQRALILAKEKKYPAAVLLFEELGRYNDSVEQWKSAMYAYVQNHRNNSDHTTYQYLTELKKYNYKNSASMYEDLYQWKANIVINNSKTDKTTKKQAISAYDTIYCHFTLTGGPPGEEVALKAVGYWPWGSYSTVKWNGENKWERGYTGNCSWWFTDPSDRYNKGTFTFKIYVGSTLIGEASVRVT